MGASGGGYRPNQVPEWGKTGGGVAQSSLMGADGNKDMSNPMAQMAGSMQGGGKVDLPSYAQQDMSNWTNRGFFAEQLGTPAAAAAPAVYKDAVAPAVAPQVAGPKMAAAAPVLSAEQQALKDQLAGVGTQSAFGGEVAQPASDSQLKAMSATDLAARESHPAATSAGTNTLWADSRYPLSATYPLRNMSLEQALTELYKNWNPDGSYKGQTIGGLPVINIPEFGQGTGTTAAPVPTGTTAAPTPTGTTAPSPTTVQPAAAGTTTPAPTTTIPNVSIGGATGTTSPTVGATQAGANPNNSKDGLGGYGYTPTNQYLWQPWIGHEGAGIFDFGQVPGGYGTPWTRYRRYF